MDAHNSTRVNWFTIRVSIALALMVLLTVATFALTNAQANTKISGRILNGTKSAPASSMANLSVNLFQMGGGKPVTATAQTDASGNFVFDNINPQIPFFIGVTYAGIKYFSDTAMPAGTATTSVSLTVYESMTLPVDYQVAQMHLIFDVGGPSIQAYQLIAAENTTDRIFLLPLPTPAGAKQITFDDPQTQSRVQTLSDGRMAFPVPPPGIELAFGYFLDAKPPSYDLNLPLPFTVNTFNLLVSDVSGIKVQSATLSPGAPFPTQSGTNYQMYSGKNLRASIKATLTNLPGADNNPFVQRVIAAAGGVGVLGLLGWTLLQKRARGANVDDTAARRIELLRAMAGLDDAYDDDQLDEDEYQDQRAELKAELIALMTSKASDA